jgi:hypothetical protein
MFFILYNGFWLLSYIDNVSWLPEPANRPGQQGILLAVHETA